MDLYVEPPGGRQTKAMLEYDARIPRFSAGGGGTSGSGSTGSGSGSGNAAGAKDEYNIGSEKECAANRASTPLEENNSGKESNEGAAANKLAKPMGEKKTKRSVKSGGRKDANSAKGEMHTSTKKRRPATYSAMRRKSTNKQPASNPDLNRDKDDLGIGNMIKQAFKKVFGEDQLAKAARQARYKTEGRCENEHLLKEGDDVAPTSKRVQIKKMGEKEEDIRATSLRLSDIALRESVTLVKNKDNNGKLFVKVPKARKHFLDVANKKVTLAEPPDEQLLLDPYSEQSAMAARDIKFFNKELVFANTVRSIISTMASEDEESKAEKVIIQGPHIIHKEWPTRMLAYKFNPFTHEMNSKELLYIRTNLGVVKASKKKNTSDSKLPKTRVGAKYRNNVCSGDEMKNMVTLVFLHILSPNKNPYKNYSNMKVCHLML